MPSREFYAVQMVSDLILCYVSYHEQLNTIEEKYNTKFGIVPKLYYKKSEAEQVATKVNGKVVSFKSEN